MVNNNIIDWKIMSSGLNAEINNGIILYGASGSGKRALLLMDELGLSGQVIAVIDSNEEKWGNNLMGYKIFNPGIVNNLKDNAIIVIASVYLKEILNTLLNILHCKQKICSIFSFRHAIHYDIMGNRANYIKLELLEKYKQEYNLWKYSIISEGPASQHQYFIDILKCIMYNPVSILLLGIQKTGNTSLRISFNVDLGNKESKNIVFTNHLSYYNEDSYRKFKEILQVFSNRTIKIITGVREPIERIISHQWQGIIWLFQHNDTCIPLLIDENYNKRNLYLEMEEKYKELQGFRNYADISGWFEYYIERLFGIDVFEYPFDKKKGYSIINKGNISIFIYRLDKLSKLEKEIGEFAENDSFVLKKSNVASDKRYMFAYQQYINQVNIKKDFFILW